jgi:hypothetical protein
VSLSDLQLPFDAFLLELPNGTLPLLGDAKEVRGILFGRSHLFFACNEPRWGTRFVTDSRVCASISGVQVEQLLSGEAESDSYIGKTGWQVAANVCMNAISWLTNQCALQEVGKGHAAWRSRAPGTLVPHGRHGEPPIARRFRIIGDVQHDFRQAVSDYMLGNGHRLTVQFMVRGHWRDQPHGPTHSLRRRQFIEPFWKGDVAAPISLRKHILGSQEIEQIGDKKAEGQEHAATTG